MNAREFFYLVSQMREAQGNYFKTRSQIDLRRARVLENQVDLEIRLTKEILAKNEP